MAIRQRRGPYPSFDAASLLPGEVAVVLAGDPGTADGRAVYVCVSVGEAKRMVTAEEAASLVANALAAMSIQYDDLSEECRRQIAASAGAGAAVITDEEGMAIIDEIFE